MEENLGMVMGFTVISAALEWLGSTWDTLQLEEEERLKRKKELEEEEEKVHFWPELGYNVQSFQLENHTCLHIRCQINILLFQKRLEGTKVTVESFLAWKAEFDAERLSKKEIVDASAKRLTGKELFLKNVTLNDSDIQFLNEGKNIVK